MKKAEKRNISEKSIFRLPISEWSKTTWCLVLAGIAGAVMILSAAVILVSIHLDYKGSEDTYAKLQKSYVVINQAEASAGQEEDKGLSQSRNQAQSPSQAQSQSQGINRTQNPNWWYEDVRIDFAKLQEENPDITGWILFDNIEGLSYPVLYSGDNEKYLRTDIYGKSTTAGCIFMEGACTPDFEDCHTILYGHNMRNSSMFGTLKKFKEKDFYKEHSYFNIYTDGKVYRYQIFAYRDVDETDAVYRVGFAPNKEFQQFVGEMAEHSYPDAKVSISKGDKVMTLSTCSTEGRRFVVHALRVEEHTYGQGG